MRFTRPDVPDPLHVAYCTNVHPGESLDEIVAQLRTYAGPVRERLGWPRLGVGLWLARPVATELAAPGAMATLRDVLAELGLEVVTLNGFPYRSFHGEGDKTRVYRPDWSEPERVAYTLDLARILARLLPEDVQDGSISTLPLAWRERWDADRAAACAHNLRRAAEGLAELQDATGRRIRLAVEPEPGCRIETTGQAAVAVAALETEHVGVCLDLCHLAVQFEEPGAALVVLAEHGVAVPKVQVASALEVATPDRPTVRDALARFDEPRFLHQVRTAASGGAQGCDDLPAALAGGLPDDTPWRVHFHTPLHAEAVPPLATTQPLVADGLTHLVGRATPVTRHLELETYTWTVLPPDRRPAGAAALADVLAAELAWVAERLGGLGWTPEPA